MSLTWAQVQNIDALAHEARRAGTPLNRCITIRGLPGKSDAQSKRHISRLLAHLGQGLQRRGQLSLGVTVYEKVAGQPLHAHRLFYVAPAHVDVVARWHDGEAVCVTEADEDGPEYVSKQRRPWPP